MDCGHNKSQSDTEFLTSFNDRAFTERTPVNGGMDITSRCNLQCVHCYIKPISQTDHHDLNTACVKRIISECADAGCLHFLITGGEPLIRTDFTDIYLHTKKAGMLVTIFTNGTLIDDKITDVFSEYPPQGVEISIYGSTAKTHDGITASQGSFSQSMAGIKRLSARKIKVSLKTMIMKTNMHEFEGMLSMAADLGLNFRADPELFPALDGDKSPIDLRVPAEQAVDLEMKLPGRKENWRKFIKKMEHIPSNKSLYECAAGMSYFHISSEGLLRPCLMTTDIGIDLIKYSFRHAWTDLLPKLFDRTGSSDFKCASCLSRIACDSCPSFFKLENGKKNVYSSYMCDITAERMKHLTGGPYDEERK